ncbi:MAG: hypothetical protein GY771_05585 [bacterium]|nr:hypothetical protein [bacterium]
MVNTRYATLILFYSFSIVCFFLCISCDSSTEPSSVYPQPPIPQGPYPADFATNVLIITELSWEIEGTAGYYAFDLYFGVEENPPLIAEEFVGTVYQVEDLDFDQTYYWKIVTRDAYGQTTEGPVWRFSTFDGIYIDEGFEGNFPPDDWFVGWGWERSGSSHSGSYSATGYVEFVDKNDKSGYVYIDLLTPWFENGPTDDRTLDLSFYYRLNSDSNINGYAGSHLVVETETAGETEESIYAYLDDQPTWIICERALSTNYLGDRFRLIFRCYAGGGVGSWGWARAFVDDILLIDSELEL